MGTCRKKGHLIDARSGHIEPTSASEQKIEKAERAQAVQLEIEKVRTLPDDYWPAEWRKHVRALGITSLALIYWMADKAKGHDFDLRVEQVLDEAGKVFLEMEHSMFD